MRSGLVLVPGVIWGASFLFIAEGLEVLPPAGVTFVRIALGWLTLSLFPQARAPVAARDWPRLAALGVTWFAFPLSVFPLAERYITSALAGLLNGGVPVFTVLIAAVVARRAPSRPVVTALLVGTAGLALVAAPNLGDGTNELTSILLVLAAVACYGVAINLAAPLQRRYGALPILWRALGVSLVLTAPLGVPALGALRWSTFEVLCLAALGVLGTAVANVLVAVMAGRVSAGSASSSNFVIPIVSVLLGVLVRGEAVRASSVAGGAVCLVAAWLLANANNVIRTEKERTR